MSLYKGRKAKKKAREFAKECGDFGLNTHIYYWKTENRLRCFASETSIILMVKCKKDPMKIQTKPHIIRYVYTKPEYRRIGQAYRLVKDLELIGMQMSVYCMNVSTVGLFKKAKYTCKGNKSFNGNPMYRFPE